MAVAVVVPMGLAEVVFMAVGMVMMMVVVVTVLMTRVTARMTVHAQRRRLQ